MSRGKIMRDTNAGSGIVFIDGEQKTFTLESNWKSGTPPKVGMVVDVELDDQGNILTVSQVNESVLAKEQAQKALNFASENGKQYFGLLLARVGSPTLISIALLAVTWIFFTTFSVRISGSNSENITFYETLKLVNIGRSLDGISALKYSGSGLYGFLMFVVILAPLAPHFHSNKYLQLSYCAPLVYMLSIGIAVYSSITSQISSDRGISAGLLGLLGNGMMEKWSAEMISMTFKAISMGLGFYISAVIAVYLGAIGIRKYLASTASV